MLRAANITKPFASLLCACALLWAGSVHAQAADPLPSWNDGPSRQSILKFVDDVTREGSPAFVPAPQRIATIDNDGTLWAEQPFYFQLLFVFDRIRALALQHPDWATREPYASVIKGDLHGLATAGEKGIAELMAVTHAGMSTDEFNRIVTDWFANARHPISHQPYTSMVYQPMLELLSYLRSKGFKTFIVSGGGVEFMRAFTEKVYGIPPEQVVGSSGVLQYEIKDGVPHLLKLPKIEFVDDGPGKPAGIQRFIGRRPILAIGNSDGDQQMLEWTAAGSGPHLTVLIHHTDAQREWAYDRKSRVGKLDKALDEATAKHWTVVDMKTEWKRIFPYNP